jgi:alanine-glyoxylate transaminase/serine-glyoxylate transaminase/serine-pyruvate transaminase
MAGKTWRIGLMGETSNPRNVLVFLAALEACLQGQGVRVNPGAGVAGANETYRETFE